MPSSASPARTWWRPDVFQFRFRSTDAVNIRPRAARQERLRTHQAKLDQRDDRGPRQHGAEAVRDGRAAHRLRNRRPHPVRVVRSACPEEALSCHRVRQMSGTVVVKTEERLRSVRSQSDCPRREFCETADNKRLQRGMVIAPSAFDGIRDSRGHRRAHHA